MLGNGLGSADLGLLHEVIALALPPPRILEPVHGRIEPWLVQHGADQHRLWQCTHGGVLALVAVLGFHAFFSRSLVLITLISQGQSKIRHQISMGLGRSPDLLRR